MYQILNTLCVVYTINRNRICSIFLKIKVDRMSDIFIFNSGIIPVLNRIVVVFLLPFVLTIGPLIRCVPSFVCLMLKALLFDLIVFMFTTLYL